MSNETNTELSRRLVLKGAAGLAGALSVTGLPTAALANLTSPTEGASLTAVCFWNEDRFIPAEALFFSESLDTCTVTVHGSQSTSFAGNLDFLHQVDVNGTETEFVHHAWTGGEYGSSSIRTTQDLRKGLSMRLTIGEKSQDIQIGGKAFGYKLGVGTYVFVQPGTSLSGISLGVRDGLPILLRGENEVDLPYLAIEIQRLG